MSENYLDIWNVTQTRAGEMFLIETTKGYLEFEVADPENGVVILASEWKRSRMHLRLQEHCIEVGDEIDGYKVLSIRKM